MMARRDKGQHPFRRHRKSADSRQARALPVSSTCCMAGGANDIDRRQWAALSAKIRTWLNPHRRR